MYNATHITHVSNISNKKRETTRRRAYPATRNGIGTYVSPYTKNYIVTVVGLGYVGLPFAIQALRNGYRIQGVDINTELIESLRQGRIPSTLEADDALYLIRRRSNISFVSKVGSASDAFVVCVPTPVREDKTPDLEPLLGAAKQIAPYIRRGTLVVIESTVSPGVCEEVVLPILENGSKLKAEKDFFFAHCPERINPGDRKWDTATIPRVLGTCGERSNAAALNLYTSVIRAPIMLMKSIKEAEAVKKVENTFRDINIAFVNELAMSFAKAGIDTVNVLKGASTKPFGFMPHYPGCGVGGHCIAVDPYYLISYGRANGFYHKFLTVARDINSRMPEYTVSLLEKKFTERGTSLLGKNIALLGLSYKRDVADMRESPALVIKEELTERGANVITFDPFLPNHSSVKTLDEALRGASGVIIATNHSAFEKLKPSDFLRHGVTIIIDGRNCLDKDLYLNAGIEYVGIGR